MFSTDLNSKETSIYQIRSRALCSQILIFYFSSFIFKDNHNPSGKIMIVKEERDGIDIDDIGNFRGFTNKY